MARARVFGRQFYNYAAYGVVGGASITVTADYLNKRPWRTAYAEAPAFSDIPEKKPIYSDYPVSVKEPTLPDSSNSPSSSTSKPKTSKPKSPSTTTTTTEQQLTGSPTPTDRLTVQVKKARLALHSVTVSTENTINEILTWTFKTETNIANTIASLAPSPETGEKLLPGAIYVLVATMAGSIISRNRGLILRAATPLGFGLVAGWSLIPVTMQNTADLLWYYEQKVPVVSETHSYIGGFTREAWKQIKERGQAVTEWADETAGQSRRRVEGWVEKGK